MYSSLIYVLYMYISKYMYAKYTYILYILYFILKINIYS